MTVLLIITCIFSLRFIRISVLIIGFKKTIYAVSEVLKNLHTQEVYVRGMFEMNCLFLSGDFKFQVSPKVLISCP